MVLRLPSGICGVVVSMRACKPEALGSHPSEGKNLQRAKWIKLQCDSSKSCYEANFVIEFKLILQEIALLSKHVTPCLLSPCIELG